MKIVNIADAKARLSVYIKRVETGETFVLARRNQPVAKLQPISRKTTSPLPMGLCAGEFKVPHDFDEPLPEAVSIPDNLILSPEHRLYQLLSRSNTDTAHGQYNALIRRLVSHERAAERRATERAEILGPDQADLFERHFGKGGN